MKEIMSESKLGKVSSIIDEVMFLQTKKVENSLWVLMKPLKQMNLEQLNLVFSDKKFKVMMNKK